MAAAFGGYRAHTPQGAARPVPPQGAKAAESPRGLAIGGMNYEAYQQKRAEEIAALRAGREA